MSWTVRPSAASRHVILRATAGEVLPEALAARLRDEGVACGWLRASGVLADVELRAFDGALGALGRTRRVAGLVQVLSLESSIGLSGGEPSLSLRALVARETDSGLEVLAGEIVSARTLALEVLVTALDDVAIERALDPSVGVWLLGAPGGSSALVPARAPARSSPAAWSLALDASDRVEPEPARPRPAAAPPPGGAPMPQRPARPGVDFDTPYPEPGDGIEHFAFGGADVLQSDGERLHIKVHKDSRIREIALQMLKVTRLPDGEGGQRRFRLERRM